MSSASTASLSVSPNAASLPRWASLQGSGLVGGRGDPRVAAARAPDDR